MCLCVSKNKKNKKNSVICFFYCIFAFLLKTNLKILLIIK